MRTYGLADQIGEQFEDMVREELGSAHTQEVQVVVIKEADSEDECKVTKTKRK